MKTKIPKLPENFKNIRVNLGLIHEVVNNILSNKRLGSASTKTRGQVSGGGKKPWRQKGTGRARIGSNRSPIWRSGGIIFGPTGKQSFKKSTTRKKRRNALIHMIVQRFNEKNIKIIDKIKLTEPKTKLAEEFVNNIFEDFSRALLLIDGNDPELARSFRNLKNITLKDWKDINAYALVGHEKILFSQKAWDGFIKQNDRKNNE